MKRNCPPHYALSLCACALAVTSCQDYDLGLTVEEIAYKKNIEAVYGKIDPQQDFNLSAQFQVTVTPGESSNIKVYAKSGAGFQLVGSYSDVVSTKTLNFDALKDVTEVMVSDGMTAQTVEVGGSVNFTGTRAVHPGSSFGGQITVSKKSEWRYFTNDEITAYTTVAPEENENTTKVTCNYTLVSNGLFTIYPIYYETSSYSTVGIYFKDALGGINMVDVYTIKEGDDFEYYSKGTVWSDAAQDYVPIGWTHDADHSSQSMCTWNAQNDPNGYIVRSHGIDINIPEGTVFGMYIRIESNVSTDLGDYKWISYSESDLNSSAYRQTTLGGPKEYINSACIDEKLAAFYTVGDNTYFSFEDWSTQCTDLNDVVFMFGGNVPTSADNDAQEWIIACEDRSQTKGDNDFNDFVFKVSHGDNFTTMNITPLAAVGTYESDLYYGDDKIGEVHQLVNPSARPNSNGLYSIINGASMGNPGPQKTVAVASNFTLQSYTPEQYTGTVNSTTRMGDFHILCKRQDHDGTGNTDAVIISAPERGDAPAMFCVPATYQISTGVKGQFVWTKENQGLSQAYPKFSDWLSNHSTNQDWYQHPDRQYLVTGDYLIKEELGGGNGSSLNEMVPMSLSDYAITMEVGDVKTVTVNPGGSDGTVSVIAGDTDKASATLDGNTITINAKAEGQATISVMMNASSDGKYGQQNKTITVNVEAVKEESGFSVDITSLNLTTIDAAQTVSIKSKNNNLPAFANVQGTAADLGTITIANSGNQDDEGFYSWTFTVTPSSEGSVSFKLKQASNATYKAGEQDVTVEVVAPTLGAKVSESYTIGTWQGYSGYEIPVSNFDSTKDITVTVSRNANAELDATQIFICSGTSWVGVNDYKIRVDANNPIIQKTVPASVWASESTFVIAIDSNGGQMKDVTVYIKQ